MTSQAYCIDCAHEFLGSLDIPDEHKTHQIVFVWAEFSGYEDQGMTKVPMYIIRGAHPDAGNRKDANGIVSRGIRIVP